MQFFEPINTFKKQNNKRCVKEKIRNIFLFRSNRNFINTRLYNIHALFQKKASECDCSSKSTSHGMCHYATVVDYLPWPPIPTRDLENFKWVTQITAALVFLHSHKVVTET